MKLVLDEKFSCRGKYFENMANGISMGKAKT